MNLSIFLGNVLCFLYKDVFNICHKIGTSHNKLYMKVTRIYRGWFFSKKKLSKLFYLGNLYLSWLFCLIFLMMVLKWCDVFEFFLGPLLFGYQALPTIGILFKFLFGFELKIFSQSSFVYHTIAIISCGFEIGF